MGKTIIVSNRLPVKVHHNEKNELVYTPSAGGLATGLSSVYKKNDNVWIGWPGAYFSSGNEIEQAAKELSLQSMRPVFLTKREISEYYEGFSNETLWPIFHYFNEYTVFKESYWQCYKEVNEKFCDEIVKVAEPEDTIWVQDYHLLLLPEMLRSKLPGASIGFFLHIPFPSFEIFRLLPWRQEILDGMLGADLLGFHTYDDMRHFLSAVNRLRFLNSKHGKILKGTRSISVDSFPMGIDYDKYARSAAAQETRSREDRYRISLGDQKIMLSVDRLDYSKGIPNRLKAFESFLKQYPEYHNKVSLLMIVVPSRDQVEKYRSLKEEIDLLVGRINGSFGRVNWTPIHYFYRSFQLSDLSAFYNMADVALVTPMRDGMNLVAKEYVASRLDKKGVLVLSEMAGASKELSEAIIVNPNDNDEMVAAMYQALTMPPEAQKRHMELMQNTLSRYNLNHWVDLFLTSLNNIKSEQRRLSTRILDKMAMDKMLEDFKNSESRLLLLNYDGTMVDFHRDPKSAEPDPELLSLLKELVDNPANEVVIVTGRGKETIYNWLGHLPLHLICEHGVLRKKNGEGWKRTKGVDTEWKKDIRQVLEVYVNRTPGSFIEDKEYSLAWHFRKVEAGLGELRSREIISHLKYLTADRKLQVLDGNKIVEIKNLEVNKGTATSSFLKDHSADFILAIGDDHTDEDTFKALPENAYTLKVGSMQSAASYSLPNVSAVRSLLKDLATAKEALAVK